MILLKASQLDAPITVRVRFISRACKAGYHSRTGSRKWMGSARSRHLQREPAGRITSLRIAIVIAKPDLLPAPNTACRMPFCVSVPLRLSIVIPSVSIHSRPVYHEDVAAIRRDPRSDSHRTTETENECRRVHINEGTMRCRNALSVLVMARIVKIIMAWRQIRSRPVQAQLHTTSTVSSWPRSDHGPRPRDLSPRNVGVRREI